MVALGAGAAVLAACGATAANTGLSEEERAALEAKGDEMAAEFVAGEVTKMKGGVIGSNDGHGIVRWYSFEKGNGFFLDQSSQDIFVHSSSLVGTGWLEVGDEVDYGYSFSPKGLVADHVKQR